MALSRSCAPYHFSIITEIDLLNSVYQWDSIYKLFFFIKNINNGGLVKMTRVLSELMSLVCFWHKQKFKSIYKLLPSCALSLYVYLSF